MKKELLSRFLSEHPQSKLPPQQKLSSPNNIPCEQKLIA